MCIPRHTVGVLLCGERPPPSFLFPQAGRKGIIGLTTNPTNSKGRPMQIIDKSPLVSEDGNISFFDRIRGSLQYGRSWFADMQAQEEAIRALSSLDNRYTLLRNLTLPDAGVPIPLILVGPTGVWVIYVSNLRGVYRAKDDSWMRMDGGHFRPVKPNLVRRTQLLARALQVYLERQGVHAPEISTALVFTDPAQHVDVLNPTVRVVLSDALDRFVLSITRQEENLTPQQIQGILAALSTPETPAASDDLTDAYDFDESLDEEAPATRTASRRKAATGPTGTALDAYLGRLNLNRKQWMVLGGMFFAEIVVLFLFVLILLFRP